MMDTVAINEISGDTALYDIDKRFVGRVNADTGRAIIGNAFWVKERTCRYVTEITDTRFDENGEEIETGDPADNCDCFECSECGFPMMYGDDGWFEMEPPYKARFNFCPNCGARVMSE